MTQDSRSLDRPQAMIRSDFNQESILFLTKIKLIGIITTENYLVVAKSTIVFALP